MFCALKTRLQTIATVGFNTCRLIPCTVQRQLPSQVSNSYSVTSKRTLVSCVRISPCNQIALTAYKPGLLQSVLGRTSFLPSVACGQQVRNMIMFSKRKCKKKTVKAVVNRFFRLQWGGWVRPRYGRDKRLWQKGWKRRQRDRQHYLVNSRYSRLFNMMTSDFYKKPTYYIDDIYEPYHKRHGVRKMSDMYKNKPLISY
ncbi:hypothetical protein CHUAL_009344 [Chamberlinius hualienensis]